LSEIRAVVGRVVRIGNRNGEPPVLPAGLGNGCERNRAHTIPQSFIVAEDERLVPDDWTAQSASELVPQPGGLGGAGFVGEEVGCVQCAVAKEFIAGAVELVGAGLDHGVDDGAGASAEFGRVPVGLDLEFLERIHRRLHDLHVHAAIGAGIGDLIDAVQDEGILRGAVPVDVEHALEADGSEARRRKQHAG